MADRHTRGVRLEVLLGDVGEVRGFLVLGEQVVERLVLARANVLGNGFVPFVGVVEFRVDVVDHATKREQAMPDHLADSELGNPDTVHVCKTLDERPFRRRKQAALLTSLPIPPRYVKVGPRIGRYNTLRKVTPQGALQRTLRGHASPAFAKLAVASGQRPIHHCWSVNRKEACTVNDKSSLPASEAEWKARLGEDTWRVLRREGTEPPFSSELNDEHRQGTFVCAGCGAPLFE